ncbi:hypothetical protein KBD81_03680 [Candidatus Woesebacteria bacterium]|nr:hypothetical protein [Candidatus Woesebacteria bacterium]
MADATTPQSGSPMIELSAVTDRLLGALLDIRSRHQTDEFSKITVSQTVSLLALAYEKVRNAIEYREDHLIRRAAIERIFRRRLSMNPKGKNEGENILRELLWARYFQNGSLDEQDMRDIQGIIDRYVYLRDKLLSGRVNTSKGKISEFLVELITAEIEEFLSPAESKKEADFGYYIFQTLKNKVKIEEVKDSHKDSFLFMAIEKAYRKSDIAYQRYHLFQLFYKPLSQYTNEELEGMITKLPDIFKKIDALIKNPNVEKLVKFVRKQLPPYLILFSLLRDVENPHEILTNKKILWSKVEQIARDKYALVRSRLNVLAFRSLIYIFVTKMVFALILEVPVSQLLYNHVNYMAIAINSLAPPLFMLLIILTVTVPGESNTQRLFLRIIEIIDKDPSFENKAVFMTKKAKNRRPILSIGFTLLYTSTFIVTLYCIHLLLKMVQFNLLSEAIFIFFISVVAFFAYRIKQIANMYRLTERTGFFSPIVDFFFMPILSLGKLFSEGVSKINFFIVIFDFIIEAPYKLIIEVIEEWINFVKTKKEDIV